MSSSPHDAAAEVLERFRAACRDDERAQAAWLGGSRGAGTADAYADVDLYVALADDDYDAFFAERDTFVDRLGRTVFRETLNIGFDVVAFIMDSGLDGELVIHRVSGLADLHTGPFMPVIDRAGILPDGAFPLVAPEAEDVTGELRVVLPWFWKDMLQFVRAIRRDRLWTAYGFLEKLRGGCQYLITLSGHGRLASDRFVPLDGYEALDHIKATPEMEMLRASVVSFERDAMLTAARTLAEIYQRLAPPAAERYGVDYPGELADIILSRLDALHRNEP